MTNIPLFSQYALTHREVEEGNQLYDPFRKLWVADDPEERVRQGLLQHLHQQYDLPPGRIAVEREIQYHARKKRFDVMVFDRQGKPWLLCECKAPSVPITQETLYQIGRYNAVLNAPHLLVTNGHQWLFFTRQPDGQFRFVPAGWPE